MKWNYEIMVYGRVQGVGYRYYVHTKAQALDLTGYTGNCRGGEVIVVAEGEKIDLDTLVDFLKAGPARARVEEVRISRTPWTGGYSDFSIRH
jgi:acylphosphatase